LVAAALSLPPPGIIIGLLLLLCGLGIRSWRLGAERAVPEALNRIAATLHGHFGLLFVPAGVGVVANIDRLAADGLALLTAVLLSTAVTIAVTAKIAAWQPKVVHSADTMAAE
jgi:putative effector of murein hydrolase LrgA (UPF0299 family)